MIVVEGPDAGGKTTLVIRLSRALELPVRSRHVTSGGEFAGDPLKWASDEMRHWPAVTGIYDRHTVLGEPIYGPIMRGRIYDQFVSTHYQALLDAFLKLKPILIYCLPQVQAVRGAFEETRMEQPDWLRAASDLQRDGVHAAYTMQMQWMWTLMGDNVFQYDWTHPREQEQFDRIVARARILILQHGRKQVP